MEENDVIQASLPSSDEAELFAFLCTYCPDVGKLFGECKSIEQLKEYVSEFLVNRYVAVKGQVQSGKTAFMICASMMILLTGMDVVIVLRNSNSDLQQIYSRLELFRMEVYSRFQKSFELTTSKKPTANASPQIVLALANGISLEKVLAITVKNYLLIVDEADHIDSGTLTKKSVVLPMLKHQAHCVVGVSATVMDLLGKEDLLPKDLILLSPPDNYRGIPHILSEGVEYIPPGAVYSSKVDSKLEENDPYLLDWIEELLGEPMRELSDGTLHPPIALVTICDTVNPCIAMVDKISRRFGGKLHVVDHHADCILIRTGLLEEETKESISTVLQRLKEGLVKPVVIFAGDIAGRGVSYVSSDYKWHLTHQRLIVSKSCPEPELIQKVRLCGVYRDDLPLRLVSTEDIASDLRKAYFKQEELVAKVREASESFQGKCRDFFKEVIFEKEKMSGRPITKDPKARPKLQLVDFAVGWDYSERDEADEEAKSCPKKEFDRLTGKMFPKWSGEEGATHISCFMNQLDPRKEYTHSEMVELVQQSGVGKRNLKNLTLISSGKSNGYGMILEVVNDRYRLFPVLQKAFEAYF